MKSKGLKTYILSFTAFLCLNIGFWVPHFATGSMGTPGEQIRLFEWSPGNTLAPLIIPVRSHESPVQGAERYLRELLKSPDLIELFLGQRPDLRLEGFKPLSTAPREQRALMIANAPKDYTLKSDRVENFKKIFAQSQHRSYILPIAANLGLSRTETQELFRQISLQFPLLVALGGEDVAPEFYKNENFHSLNTVPERDKFEIALIKSYVAAEKGFLLGVCRGSQISAVALGYKLIQDLPFHKGAAVQHSNHWHPIEVTDTQHGLLKSLTSPQSRELFVNSLHHQSVVMKPHGPLEVAARGQDGVTEATELKNGRGLLLQFHPELMGNELGALIIKKALHQKNKVLAPFCGRVFAF